MGFFAAVQFLTVIPLPASWTGDTRVDMRSTLWFPVVGLLIGVILALAVWLLSFVFTHQIVITLILIISAGITGMLHLDGFIDTCDGVFGNRPVEKRWMIMRDSRAGSYGIVGVVLLIVLKFALMSEINTQQLIPSMVIMSMTGRWAMVYGLFAHRYARAEGIGKSYKEGTNLTSFIVATAITAAVYGAFIPLTGYYIFIAGAAAALVAIILGLFFSRRLSGLTGDTYGALNEIAEITVLIAIVLIAKDGIL